MVYGLSSNTHYCERNPNHTLHFQDVGETSVNGKSQSESPRYIMDRNKKNLALIINNEKFDKSTGLFDRQGSNNDHIKIKHALESLRFNVISRKNLSMKHTRQIFEDIASMDHANYNCFVCIILTHGEDDDQIWCTNGKIKFDNLVEMLLPDKCPTLTGKPKLFFLQASRGLKYDSGELLHDAEVSRYSEYKSITSLRIPLWADVLLAYSTVPGFYSWRHTTNGSWFIQSLAKVLEENGGKHELLRLMTSVNRMVANEYESLNNDMNGMKQVPCITSMLTKQLFFYQ